jgi:D-glycero-D-manno-heptose 1,7-bisphosphate phosphatase
MGTDERHGSRAIFLDRDGVINHNILNPATGCYESPLTEDDFQLVAGVLPALRDLQAAGYLLFLVSNQPNYAKGKTTLDTLNAIQRKLERALFENGILFAAFYYCRHHPQAALPELRNCVCRKPSPYFLRKAEADFGVDLRRSWMLGDRATDMSCGIAAGTKTILIGEHIAAYARRAGDNKGADYEEGPLPDRRAPDLAAAAKLILAEA